MRLAAALLLALAAVTAGADEALDIAVRFLEAAEGFRAAPYCDSAGNATIGYGELLAHDCGDLGQWPATTREAARAWIETRAAHVLADVRHHVAADLRPAQEAALVSLAYNIGEQALEGSHLVLLINTGQPLGVIVGEFVTWDKEHRAGRKVRSRGLSNRRAREVALYLSAVTVVGRAPE